VERIALGQIAVSELLVLCVAEGASANNTEPVRDGALSHQNEVLERRPTDQDSWRKLIEHVEEICDKWLDLASGCA